MKKIVLNILTGAVIGAVSVGIGYACYVTARYAPNPSPLEARIRARRHARRSLDTELAKILAGDPR